MREAFTLYFPLGVRNSVVGLSGMFTFDPTTNIASKIIDNNKEDLILEVRRPENSRMVYYTRNSRKDIIQRFEIGRGALEPITFE